MLSKLVYYDVGVVVTWDGRDVACRAGGVSTRMDPAGQHRVGAVSAATFTTTGASKKASTARMSTMRKVVLRTRRHQRSVGAMQRLPSLVKKVRPFPITTWSSACALWLAQVGSPVVPFKRDRRSRHVRRLRNCIAGVQARSKSSLGLSSAGSIGAANRRSRGSLHGIVAVIGAAREAAANHAAVEALAEARKLRRMSKVCGVRVGEAVTRGVADDVAVA